MQQFIADASYTMQLVQQNAKIGLNYAIAYIQALPYWLCITVKIVLGVAALNILAAHAVGLYRGMRKWKQKENSNLTYSIFGGTGFEQRNSAYAESQKLNWGKPSFIFSFAGVTEKLGGVKLKSKFLLFLLSLIYIPLKFLGFCEILIRRIVGTAYLLVFGFLHWLALVVLYFAYLLIIPIFKFIDRKSRIDQHCPHCYRVFRLPAYVCPKCQTVHNDLIPGMTGIFTARCMCGEFLPSMVLTGRSKLDSICPRCNQPLAASNADEFTLLLLGGNTSGKTAYLSAFFHSYIESVQQFGKHIQLQPFPAAGFEDLERIYSTGVTSESSKSEIIAYNLVHQMGVSGERNLVIYDVPDEVVLSDDYERNPLNYSFADGAIILFDPLSDRTVRQHCLELGYDIAPDTYSNDSIEDISVSFINQYTRIVNRAAEKMVDLPVSVVITKIDIPFVAHYVGNDAIKKIFMTNPGKFHNDIQVARNSICRNFIMKLGYANTVNNLESVFYNVQYFAVSAMGNGRDSSKNGLQPVNVLDPVVWLGSVSGARLASILDKMLPNYDKRDAGDVKGLETEYNKGIHCLKTHDFAGAERIFRSLGSFKDAENLLNSISNRRYEYAYSLIQAGQYESGIQEMVKLGDFKDAKAVVIAAMYELGKNCAEKQQYEKALKCFQLVPQYKDAGEQAKEMQYHLAAQKLKSGDAKGAYEIYRKLGSYRDSVSRIRSMAPALIRQGVRKGLPFGRYIWNVVGVDKQRGFALLISREPLFKAAYHYSGSDSTWATSDLRAYLNEEFLSSFTDKEKTLIFPVITKTQGSDESYDSVFILTDQEVERYFADEAARAGAVWCWLRSPGINAQYACCVETDGSINQDGRRIGDPEGGVRPALWITI